ncbi:MAG: glycosyltransferase [Geminicoccaceae bacterium]
MDQHPSVAVIIPHLNDPVRLRLTLEALASQTYPEDRFEVIVVDNGSREPVEPVIDAFPGVRLVHQPVPGCGSARNGGVDASSSDILAFTDADCIPEADWLERAVRRFSAPNAVDIVGGRINVFAIDPDRPGPVEAFERVFAFRQRLYTEKMNFAAGANLLARRAVYDRTGPFKDADHPDDVEWGQRAVAAGFTIGYADDAVVNHPARADWDQLSRKWQRNIEHKLTVAEAGRLYPFTWIAAAIAVAFSGLPHLWAVATSDNLASFDQRRAAASVLVRIRLFRAGYMLKAAWQRLVAPDSRRHWREAA